MHVPAIKSKYLVMSSVDVLNADVKTSGMNRPWGLKKTKMMMKIMNLINPF